MHAVCSRNAQRVRSTHCMCGFPHQACVIEFLTMSISRRVCKRFYLCVLLISVTMLPKACISSDMEDLKIMKLPPLREDPAIVASRFDQEIAAAKKRRLSHYTWVRPMVTLEALHVTVVESFFNIIL